MKHLKSLLIGAGVGLFNISTVVTQVFRNQQCTGSCGSCGFACVPTIASLTGIGIIIIFIRKVKFHFKKVKLSGSKK